VLENNEFSELRCSQFNFNYDNMNSYRSTLFNVHSIYKLFEIILSNEQIQSHAQRKVILYYLNCNLDSNARPKIRLHIAFDGQIVIVYAKLASNIFAKIKKKLHLELDDFNVMINGKYISHTDVYTDQMNRKTFYVSRKLYGGSDIVKGSKQESHMNPEIFEDFFEFMRDGQVEDRMITDNDQPGLVMTHELAQVSKSKLSSHKVKIENPNRSLECLIVKKTNQDSQLENLSPKPVITAKS
jgi:glutaredoxin-related protein